MVESDEGGTTLQHKFLHTYFSIGRKGRLVFGVDNLTDRQNIEAIMERFRKAGEP
jgi:hypothetical protein